MRLIETVAHAARMALGMYHIVQAAINTLLIRQPKRMPCEHKTPSPVPRKCALGIR